MKITQAIRKIALPVRLNILWVARLEATKKMAQTRKRAHPARW